MYKYEKQISIGIFTVVVLSFTGNFFWMVCIKQPFLAVFSLVIATVALYAARYTYKND